MTRFDSHFGHLRSGTISGSANLTAEQVDNLRKGRLYIQVHSEKGVAPDGSNLWGWFSR